MTPLFQARPLPAWEVIEILSSKAFISSTPDAYVPKSEGSRLQTPMTTSPLVRVYESVSCPVHLYTLVKPP